MLIVLLAALLLVIAWETAKLDGIHRAVVRLVMQTAIPVLTPL